MGCLVGGERVGTSGSPFVSWATTRRCAAGKPSSVACSRGSAPSHGAHAAPALGAKRSQAVWTSGSFPAMFMAMPGMETGQRLQSCAVVAGVDEVKGSMNLGPAVLEACVRSIINDSGSSSDTISRGAGRDVRLNY